MKKSSTLPILLAALLSSASAAHAKIAVSSLQHAVGNADCIFLGKVDPPKSATTAQLHVVDILKPLAQGTMPDTITIDTFFTLHGEPTNLNDHPDFIFFATKSGPNWSGIFIFLNADGTIIPTLRIATPADLTTRATLTSEIQHLLSKEYRAQQINILNDTKAEDSVRAAAARTLGDLRAPDAWPALEAAALNKTSPDETMRDSLRALYFIDENKVGPVALKVIQNDPDISHVTTAAVLINADNTKDPQALDICLAAVKRFESNKTLGNDVADMLLGPIASFNRRTAEVDVLVRRRLADATPGTKSPALAAAAQLKMLDLVPQFCDLLATGNESDARYASLYLTQMLGAASHPGDGTPLPDDQALAIAQRDLPDLALQFKTARIINGYAQIKILALTNGQFIYIGWFTRDATAPTLKAILTQPKPANF